MLDLFEGSEELSISIGRAYIVTAALEYFGMSSTDDAPTINKMTANISQTEENKKKYFDAFDGFINKYLFQKDNDSDDDDNDDDYIRNYALWCIFLTIQDTSTGDGEQNLINKKLFCLCSNHWDHSASMHWRCSQVSLRLNVC